MVYVFIERHGIFPLLLRYEVLLGEIPGYANGSMLTIMILLDHFRLLISLPLCY